MSLRGALIVIGSGPGIGRSTAAYFAEKGFKHIFLLSRDQYRLAEDAQIVAKAAPDVKVETYQIDLAADEGSVKSVLGKIDLKLKAFGVPLEVVLYNAARVGPSKLLEWNAKDLETDVRITTFSLYVTLQWAMPQLLETAKSQPYNPAFLTTSGSLYREPYPVLFSLSVAKAAQHNLISSFHYKFEPQIHFALIPIAGVVNGQANITPRAVAEEFWRLYEQPKGTKGKLSVDMNDPDFLSMMEVHYS